MNETKTAPKAHSEDYFGEYRDYWWNPDFLQLMNARLHMDQARIVLDVGCGVGHWGQLLAPFFGKEPRLIGIDREEVHLLRARERAHQRGLAARFHYQIGDVTALPFASESFDMVTCQTVMIHLKDPEKGLREMLRVLKPGGLLLIAEPNNFASQAVASSLTQRLSVDEILERMKFDLLIQCGKKALGLGFNSEGDFIPGHLATLGAEAIQVHQSDKATPFFPPYSTSEEMANIRQMRDWAQREFIGWDRGEMQKYFIAGGGDPAQFDRCWKQGLQDAKDVLQAIDNGSFHCAGGGISYLISARK